MNDLQITEIGLIDAEVPGKNAVGLDQGVGALDDFPKGSPGIRTSRRMFVSTAVIMAAGLLH
jgi:hypothetical protein